MSRVNGTLILTEQEIKDLTGIESFKISRGAIMSAEHDGETITPRSIVSKLSHSLANQFNFRFNYSGEEIQDFQLRANKKNEVIARVSVERYANY